MRKRGKNERERYNNSNYIDNINDIFDINLYYDMKQKLLIKKIYMHQNNVKYTKFGAYKTKNLIEFEKLIYFQLKNSNEFANDLPKKIEIEVLFPIPRSYTKAKKNEILGKYHTKKPDLDNIIKTFLDVLQKKYNFDDKTISELELKKKYNNNTNEKNYIIKFQIKEIN